MAFIPNAQRALNKYVNEIGSRDPHKFTIVAAVVLTETQRQGISDILSKFWGKPYACPLVLDVKPQHGFKSRVQKDQFEPQQFVEWLILGCSDIAEVGDDERGRPNLVVKSVKDQWNVNYDVLVPIRSDADGTVHIDDVIPKGLAGRQKK